MPCASCGKPGASPTATAPPDWEPRDDALQEPMYVMPVLELLKLEQLPPHEELRRRGALKEWQPSMQGRVLCVSHQWLAFGRPDPAGEHLQTLSRVLSRLLDGGLEPLRTPRDRSGAGGCAVDWKKELPHMYIWLDYLSMPQLPHACQDPQRAAEASADVKSMPAYFERASLILVLAPVCLHHDTGEVCNYASWRERGWCRLEMMVALLARSTIPIMVCPGPEAIPYFLWPLDMIWLPAGEGKFSCCMLDHCFGPCDKVHFRSVLEDMLDAKVQYLQGAGRITESRYWAVKRNVFVRGLPGAGSSATAQSKRTTVEPNGQRYTELTRLEHLCSLLCWDDQDDIDALQTGCTLMLWSALSGDSAAVWDLATHKGGRINAALRQTLPGLPGMLKGLTPLLAAMGHADWATVEVLLDARADPLAVTEQGQDALMLAAAAGRSGNVRAWLGRFGRWDLKRADLRWGASAAQSVGGTGAERADILAALLKARAHASGREPMLCALAARREDSAPGVLRLLLDRRCDVNAPWEPPTLGQRALLRARARLERVSPGRFAAEPAAGSTALHFAAQRGDVPLVRCLLQARAEPRRNYQGRTPLEAAARAFGGELPPVLLAALLGEDAQQEGAARRGGA